MTTPEHNPSAAVTAGFRHDDDFSDEFQCCVCLDLIYKPVVLACGHISCFWCVFRAMDTCQVSQCPVCRHSFYYFPSICWLLHSVLLKLYPKVYQRRESQVMKEEKSKETFSTQFEKMPLQFQAMEHGKDSVVKESLEPVLSDNIRTTGIPTSLSDNNVAVERKTANGNDHVDECYKQIAITDLLCAICKELLCRPVVLNCGHVFCEVCVVDSSNEPCQCPVCKSMHPIGFPKVCLVLEGFLEQHVSKEYAARKLAIDKLETCGQGGSSTAQVPQDDLCMDRHICESGHKVHFGVGCDCCGMFPLIGDRYKCKDCVEHIGFDLCEGCYKTSSNLPGRFNQQHKPDHKFDLIEPDLFALSPEYQDDQPQDNEGIEFVLLRPEPDAVDAYSTSDISGDSDEIEPTS